jgi:hypothetical protein
LRAAKSEKHTYHDPPLDARGVDYRRLRGY